jgi:hypothetical protein
MDLSNSQVKAYQARIFLKSTPRPIVDRILSDRSFVVRMGMTVQSTLHFDGTTQVTADDLVLAARSVLRGSTTVEIRTKGGERLSFKGQISDGSLLLTPESGPALVYDYVEALSSDVSVRLAAIDRLVRETLVSTSRGEFWRTIAASGDITATDFVDLIKDIRATPEMLRDQLRGVPNLGRDALVPRDPSYWSTLLPLTEGDDFESYVGKRLPAHQESLMKLNPKLAMSRIGYTAATPSTVRNDLMGSLKPEDFSICTQKNDPFSLLFAFEVAAYNLHADQAWEMIGTESLTKLFSSKEEFDDRGRLLAASTIIAYAGLSKVAPWRAAPIYWRRLAAFSHAGVLTDSLWGMCNPEAFLKWAMNHFAAGYHWQVLFERREAPLWWPDAIEPGTIKAELCARFINAMQSIDEAEWPTAWKATLERITDKILTRGEGMMMAFPGPFEDFDGFKRSVEVSLFEATLKALKESPFKIPGLKAFIHLCPLTEIELSVLKDFVNRSDAPAGSDMEAYLSELTVITHACAAYRDISLANALAEKAMHLFKATDGVDRQTMIAVIVDAANAFQGEDESLMWLAQWFDRLANLSTSEEEVHVTLNVIELLRESNPKCAAYLSGARATLEIKRRQKVRGGAFAAA